RVLDREAGAEHLVVDVVDLAACEIGRALGVDVDPDALPGLDDVVAGGLLIFPAQLVGHPRAPSADHADAQAPLGLALLQAQIGYLLRGRLRHRDHTRTPSSSIRLGFTVV